MSKLSACCHCAAFAHAEMAALKVIKFGETPPARICSSSASARSHCPLFWQAEIAALKLIVFGSTPALSQAGKQRGWTRL